MWWFHLLVRKRISLRDRVIVCERVMRAVGSFPYAERAPPLLVALCEFWRRDDTNKVGWGRKDLGDL